jgi:chemotaxis protein methyltransferase CheR
MEGVSNYHRLKYFVKKDTQYEVKQSLKKMVAFDFHNLKHDNGLTNLDIIFCRNVMIYFDRPQQIHLIERLHQMLRPGGYLFLGHAETLHGLSDKFKFIYNNKATAYRKIED